jgi:hypothetical protein
MKKIIIMILGAILAAISSIFAQDLDQVLKQYHETIGADKVLQMQTVYSKGKVMQFGMEMEYTNYITRSGKYYLEVPIQGQLMKNAYNGEVAWMVAPWTGTLDPIELTGIQLKSMKRQADMDGMLYNYAEKGYTTTLEGTEDLEGTKVYLIKQVDADGDIFVHYMDAENYVLLKTKATLAYQGSTIEAETYYSNYKPVDGVIMPFSMESKVNGQTQSTIVIEEYAFNKPVDDALFEKPASAPKPEGQE